MTEPKIISVGKGRASASVQPSPTDVHGQLTRILASPAFNASPRRRELLQFLVDETLAGRADRLKGFTLASAVFGRDETFDPQADPVVRLEARRLRRDLDSYYVDAGSLDPVRITIPKGAYVAHFDWQKHARPPDGPISAPTVPESLPRTTPEPEGPADGGATGREPSFHRFPGARTWLAMAAVVLLVSTGAAWLLLQGPSQPLAEGVRGPAVIVLPFESLGGGDDGRFLASGVTQELIADLMRFSGFRLYSVPASFGQDEHGDALKLGHDLDVEYVVKGSVSTDATTIRVGAQLFNAQTGQVLWSETYDRALTSSDLLGLRAELAANIATVLGQPYGVVTSDLSARLTRGVAPSMASYACVLRAYTYRRTFRDELRQPVLACLDAAVQRDPDYAEAWAMLGWLHLDAARYFVPDSEVQGELAQAVDMASRAVAIEPKNVVALQALSAIQYHLGNFDESERTQRQALALNPNDPDTLAQLAWRLAFRGRWAEGLAYSERAIARTVDPPGWYYDPTTIHLYLEGRYREMLASAEHSAAGDSQGVAFLAIAYGALGNHTAAQEALATMAKQAPDFARDPAAAFRRFRPLDSIVEALMDGLRKAGWKEPAGSPRL